MSMSVRVNKCACVGVSVEAVWLPVHPVLPVPQEGQKCYCELMKEKISVSKGLVNDLRACVVPRTAWHNGAGVCWGVTLA